MSIFGSDRKEVCHKVWIEDSVSADLPKRTSWRPLANLILMLQLENIPEFLLSKFKEKLALCRTINALLEKII